MQDRYEAFTVLIARFSRIIRKIKSEEMAEFDLKGPHVSCLYYLFKRKRMTAKELCEICDEDKASVSRSLERLEKDGFIEYETTEHKRYKSEFKLTGKGEEVAARVADKVDGVLLAVEEGVSEEQRAAVYEGLNAIIENLNKYCEKYDI